MPIAKVVPSFPTKLWQTFQPTKDLADFPLISNFRRVIYRVNRERERERTKKWQGDDELDDYKLFGPSQNSSSLRIFWRRHVPPLHGSLSMDYGRLPTGPKKKRKVWVVKGYIIYKERESTMTSNGLVVLYRYNGACTISVALASANESFICPIGRDKWKKRPSYLRQKVIVAQKLSRLPCGISLFRWRWNGNLPASKSQSPEMRTQKRRLISYGRHSLDSYPYKS